VTTCLCGKVEKINTFSFFYGKMFGNKTLLIVSFVKENTMAMPYLYGDRVGER
jgi:hypothetical protein